MVNLGGGMCIEWFQLVRHPVWMNVDIDDDDVLPIEPGDMALGNYDVLVLWQRLKLLKVQSFATVIDPV